MINPITLTQLYLTKTVIGLQIKVLMLILGNFCSLPEKKMLIEKVLIVFVHSRPNAIQERITVRNTWGKHGMTKIKNIHII